MKFDGLNDDIIMQGKKSQTEGSGKEEKSYEI